MRTWDGRCDGEPGAAAGTVSALTCRATRCRTRSPALLDRRVTRRYTEQDVPDSLLDALLAAAQSAPAKSDLQQFSVVVMRDRARIKQIADWIGTMDWIATAPVFLVWCGDMRRGQRLCAMHDMPHANNNLDTFLNTAVDCTLAMAQFMAAADAVGLGTCPISYVRSHIERVSPLLGLPSGVYPVAGLTRRLAGVPPPGIDAPAAVGRGAPGTL